MATFPLIPLVQLRLNGVWTNVASDVYQKDAIQIQRGRPNEGTSASPSSCNLTFDNRTGKYSPRNPLGPYYGAIGRNTPLRVLTDTSQTPYMDLPGLQISRARTFDPIGASGDTDIRVDVEPRSWRPLDRYGFASRWRDGDYTIARSWTFYMDTAGILWFGWSPDGTTTLLKGSTAPVPSASGRLSLRVTLDVDNGAAGNTVTFYTAPSFTGTYTQLGSTVVTAGVTSVGNPTSYVEVGRASRTTGADLLLQGRVYRMTQRNSIGGTVIVGADFSALDSEVTSFTGDVGATWELSGNAVIVRPGARFHGEVSAWPLAFGKTDSEQSVPVSAAGVLRRLGQGEEEPHSALYRAMTRDSTVVAYWPTEDEQGSTSFASGITNGWPMTFSGAVSLAADADFPPSEAIPFASGVPWYGPVKSFTQPVVGGISQVSVLRFLVHIIDSGLPTPATIIRMEMTGSSHITEWDVQVDTVGSVRVIGRNSADVAVVNSGYVSYAINGRMMAGQLEISRGTTDIGWILYMTEVGATTPDTGMTGTPVASAVPGKVTRVVVNPDQVMQESSIGQISVHNRISPVPVSLLAAHAGETGPVRLARLCDEEDIPFSLVGDRSHGALLGPMYPDKSFNLISEVETSDLGMLYEPRGYIGLAYRTRESLYSQTAAATLNYTAYELSQIQPVEDDQNTRNDVRVIRRGGTSARDEATSGALSVNDPPSGVGRYSAEVTLSLYDDSQAMDQASWRVHLGTVDEPRFPLLGVNLASPALESNSGLSTSLEALDVGARVELTNLPIQPRTSAQMVQGIQEMIGQYEWIINLLSAPGSAWEVGVFNASSGTGEARYMTEGTALTGALTASATSVGVTTATGPVWSATDAPYDLLVGGERIRVTAVSGAGAAQTLTVVRAINGVVKSHAAGAAVTLYKPARYAL